VIPDEHPVPASLLRLAQPHSHDWIGKVVEQRKPQR